MNSLANNETPIIFFDGICNLCTDSVRFVIARDSQKRFRFASLQSTVAEQLLDPQDQQDGLESMVLIMEQQIYRKSTAALMTAQYLDGLWPVLRLLLIIPQPLRDILYDWIGKRRYRFFGKREACWKPSPDLADRFLE